MNHESTWAKRGDAEVTATMPAATSRIASALPGWAAVALVAVLYYVAARLGLVLAFEKTNASPVWPPSGLAFAAVLLLSPRVWPGVFAGAFVANLAVFASNQTTPFAILGAVSASIAMGNTLEALAGAWLFRRWIGADNALGTAGAVLRFVGAALVMCLVSAGLGSASLLGGGIIPGGIWGTVALTWWIGDVAGVLILTPALMLLCGGSAQAGDARRRGESAALLLGLIVVAAIPFGGWLPRGLDQALMFLLFPAFLWPVFRLGQREAAVAVVGVSLLAIWQTEHGVGPFRRDALNESLLLLQGFVCVISITIHALAAALAERRRVAGALVQANEDLTRRTDELLTLTRTQDQIVAERTHDLAAANADLARSNQELDDFAYISSHDLKEPLRGIHNYTQFLLEDYGAILPEEGKAKCQTLVRLTARMEALIESLLYFSRVGREDLAMTDADLDQVVKDVIDSIDIRLQETGVAVRLPRPLPTVRCDPVRVREVFQNLITNAMKYNDKAEKWIEVGWSAAEPPVFYVRDNGIGIRPNHLQSMFRIFKRLHGRDKFGGGTGVGLTIAKKIVERHGGRIWVESTVGEGTTFHFTLHRETPTPEPHD